MENVIFVNLDSEFINLVKQDIAQRNAVIVRKELIEHGYHPSFIAVLFRKILKRNV